MEQKRERVVSIDIFRALTMFFMIFVNDLWTLKGYPKWLGHTATHEDGMGFSDVIFPAFLFIVGLSIPLAIKHREKIGNDKIQIINHVLKRSLALIFMGFFIVNFEYINTTNLMYSKYVWEILMVFSFFLIWNNYKDHKIWGKVPSYIPQIAAVLILIFLAASYQGGTVENPSVFMKPHWWGILGLIGWSYLACTIIFLYLRNSSSKLFIALVILFALNISEFLLPELGLMKITFIVGASNYVPVMAGVYISVLLKELKKDSSFIQKSILFAVVSLALGFALRPFWGISKNLGTPSWTLICVGISTLSFITIYFIADMKKLKKWASPLKPAGRSTLTTYLLPYYYYPIIALLGITLPEYLLTGTVGIIKSLVFAALMIAITKVLELLKVRLKI